MPPNGLTGFQYLDVMLQGQFSTQALQIWAVVQLQHAPMGTGNIGRDAEAQTNTAAAILIAGLVLTNKGLKRLIPLGIRDAWAVVLNRDDDVIWFGLGRHPNGLPVFQRV